MKNIDPTNINYNIVINKMPSFLSHAIISYLIFGKRGAIYSILPDLVGFSYCFGKIFYTFQEIPTIDTLLRWGDIFPQSEMQDFDWFLYDISHSLPLWFLIYYLTKDKAVYAAILSIIMDVFLHERDVWEGPAFMYPLSNYRFDGIHWLSVNGILITMIVKLVVLILSSKIIKKWVNALP